MCCKALVALLYRAYKDIKKKNLATFDHSKQNDSAFYFVGQAKSVHKCMRQGDTTTPLKDLLNAKNEGNSFRNLSYFNMIQPETN